MPRSGPCRREVAITIVAITRETLTHNGWEIVSTTQVVPALRTTTELHLVIRQTAGSRGSPWVADGTTSSLVLQDPSAGASALRYSPRCTPTGCKTRLDDPGCFAGIACPRGGQSVPLTSAGGLEPGSLITFASSEQSGKAQEVVIGTDPARQDVPLAVLADQVGYELISKPVHVQDR